ncbi:MAG TPA: DUF485 domain-containing protein [Tepidisphaeraceae bacterium]
MNDVITRNARLGLGFFFVYAAVYSGFVAICTFRYDWMGTIVFAGLNLAIVYGMGLIVLAVVMAVIYMLLCKPDDERAD